MLSDQIAAARNQRLRSPFQCPRLSPAPQQLLGCPVLPAGAFPSGTISGPYPEAQRRRAPKEGGKHVARSLYVARWTSVFLLHDVIYSHTQKLSASWSFSVGFGRVEQM